MFGKPEVFCEHVEADQKVGIYIMFVFCCQVLCVTKQGHRNNVYLQGVSTNISTISAHNLVLDENRMWLRLSHLDLF